MCFTGQTADGEIVEFASGWRPTSVAEGTNYCTTNWCTTQDSSIFTYAEGEDHGTFDLCDAAYSAPTLPDVVPASTIEVNGQAPVIGRDRWFCPRWDLALPALLSERFDLIWCGGLFPVY